MINSNISVKNVWNILEFNLLYNLYENPVVLSGKADVRPFFGIQGAGWRKIKVGRNGHVDFDSMPIFVRKNSGLLIWYS